MFDYYMDSFFLNKTVFTVDYMITMAVFKVQGTKDKKKIFPYTNTSAGKNKPILFAKLHNEFLERFKMVNNHYANKNTTLISINDLKKSSGRPYCIDTW